MAATWAPDWLSVSHESQVAGRCEAKLWGRAAAPPPFRRVRAAAAGLVLLDK